MAVTASVQGRHVARGVAVTSSVVALSQIAKFPPSNLFLYHPLLAGLVIPTTTAATIAVRSRLRAARLAQETGGKGRDVLVQRIRVHFFLTATATLAAFGAFGAIFANKVKLGKAHFLSVHAKAGLGALVLWVAALSVAEKNVWKNGLPCFRDGKFVYAPRWVWSSKWHKRLGIAAYVAMLAAVATGTALTPYGANLPGQRTALAALLVTALAMFAGGGAA
eukprot:CAMPEP_0118901954 /NCGR_PEP_ID=MMETSP1166-20130328/7452_1 /TAXON_ID=1104430 /ORGANISM="Chrysoreinhardia sp, Strain CCMP3193" /LENGTH=220 /DNA_ID=CAMNT_0006841145 /DNA_START=60 /DNA_END=722 /DNA_ORIENTATION=+